MTINANSVGECPEMNSRGRVPTACEACRATKIRCRPSDQPGVCRKCLESKRECVSRTGPRTRRPRRAKATSDGQSQQSVPPPNASSTTFSLNFNVSAQHEIDDNFEYLRESHELMIESVLSRIEDPIFATLNFTTPSAEGSLSSPPSSTSPSYPIEDMHGQPRFNLASAESLLTFFHSMLPRFPCILLPAGATVRSLAATKPFVLLAILASASGSRTLQGHRLYDAEFRKVLGLKFVAGGERCLELLQGLLIYCAWYPFHLRPKNKQIFHYVRMASDLVHDLDLDQRSHVDIYSGVTEEHLDGIRAYLAHSYLTSAFMVTWKKYKGISSSFTPWVMTCCDVLQANAQTDDDLVLATIVRYSNIASDASDAINGCSGRTEQQMMPSMIGLDTQARELQMRGPAHIASTGCVRISNLFVDFYLSAGVLVTLPRPRLPFTLTTSKLSLCVAKTKSFLSHILTLDPLSLSFFTVVDWGRLIIAIVLAFRLSFPLPECSSFDHIWARSELQLDGFLKNMCGESELTAATKKVDVLSASKVVMKVVKKKYERRLELSEIVNAGQGCPMLDGSLDEYLLLWDAGLDSMTSSTTAPLCGKSGSQPVAFHDLWATMTMGWAREDHPDQ